MKYKYKNGKKSNLHGGGRLEDSRKISTRLIHIDPRLEPWESMIAQYVDFAIAANETVGGGINGIRFPNHFRYNDRDVYEQYRKGKYGRFVVLEDYTKRFLPQDDKRYKILTYKQERALQIYNDKIFNKRRVEDPIHQILSRYENFAIDPTETFDGQIGGTTFSQGHDFMETVNRISTNNIRARL